MADIGKYLRQVGEERMKRSLGAGVRNHRENALV
jgi:hypothetical protein